MQTKLNGSDRPVGPAQLIVSDNLREARVGSSERQ